MHLRGSLCANGNAAHANKRCHAALGGLQHRCLPMSAAAPWRTLDVQHAATAASTGRALFQACASTSAAASSSAPSTAASTGSRAELKAQLRQALTGINGGIFGTQASKRQEVMALLEQLEAANPLPNPTEHLEQVAGDWRLLYTTITITGSKKTKLGLREFVKLGDFIQNIDTARSLATNTVAFSVAGLGTLSGSLTVKASYAAASSTRVNITFEESTLVPEKLQQIFQANYKLLLSIFNPDGWLDITYVDEELRVGRDDKGNLFLLERCA